MADIKLTKNELRNQQTRLSQLEKYLPTLQLKKAMLQSQVAETRSELARLRDVFSARRKRVESYSALLTERTSIDPIKVVRIKSVRRRYENIAGVEIPYYEGVDFEEFTYNLFETPPWVDAAILGLRVLAEASMHIKVVEEQIEALEKELKEVSIRVNLFEKILIPRAVENIKKIKVFLGDQQLAAVSQAKVAKGKIEATKEVAFLARLKESS